MLFDRICRENGIRHLLTAPRSPTTTGKVERFHKTLKAGCLTGRVFASDRGSPGGGGRVGRALQHQAAHQSIGMVPPIERFALARPDSGRGRAPEDQRVRCAGDAVVAVAGLRGVTRWVDQAGRIGLGGFRYHVGRFFAGELVEAICRNGLVEITHRGVLVASHAQRRPPGTPAPQRSPQGPAVRRRVATVGSPVIRHRRRSGNVSFAGTPYRAGRAYRGRSSKSPSWPARSSLAVDGKVVRIHPIRHDRSKEHGAFANPEGRPRKPRTVA